MKRLTIEQKGDKAQGVTLRGDRRNPEPETFRVTMPCGEVDIVRNEDDSYWIHISTQKPSEEHGVVTVGTLTDARLDVKGMQGDEPRTGDFSNPKLFHLAVRIAIR